MKTTNKRLIFFLIMLMTIFVFPVSVNAANDAGCVAEAKEHYKQYGHDLNILGCEGKYDGTEADKYAYAITYVTKGGQIMNIYLNEIPKDFNLWNTDIVVSDGRVVVTGVNGDTENTWNIVFSKYRGFIIGVSGLATLSCVLGFVLTLISLATKASIPSERSKFIGTLLLTGVGATGLGAVTIIFSFFWNLI